MNLDSMFFDGAGHDDELSGYNDGELLRSNSTLSEGSNGFNDCRYLQITLSSGGIVEKSEPTIAMSTTEESSVVSDLDYQSDCSGDASHDGPRKGKRKHKKGAKKFFFGKHKKKIPAEF